MKEPIENLTINPVSHLKRDEFASMFAPTEDGRLVATFLLPMEKKGVETRKNPIVFKNALKKAQDLAEGRGDNSTEQIGRVLQQLEALASDDVEFWQEQQNGLALVVRDSGEMTAFKTPFPLEEFVWVGKRPRLGRLLPLADELRFFILALDLNQLRLFEATRWDVQEIEIEHGPTSLDEAMKYDDPEKSLQHHSSGASPGPNGRVDAVHHGHGGGSESDKSIKIQRYFEMVDKNLTDNLPDHNSPMVLFGPDSEVGHYREANSYTHLHDGDIRLNPSNQSDEELSERILNWVEVQAEKDTAAALESLQNHIGQDRGSTDFEEVFKATVSGRVETLFIKQGATRYGTYNPETHAVSSHDENTRDSEENELIELAVMTASAAGGQIRYVDSSQIPDESDIAASYRF